LAAAFSLDSRRPGSRKLVPIADFPASDRTLSNVLMKENILPMVLFVAVNEKRASCGIVVVPELHIAFSMQRSQRDIKRLLSPAQRTSIFRECDSA
jgi:hypothetical protein